MIGAPLLAATLAVNGLGPAASPVSLPDALAAADRVAAVLVARADALVERRRVDIVRAPGNPVVTLGTARYSARKTASVTQDLRWGGERGWSVAAAAAAADSADAAAAGALREARRRIRRAWFALAAAEDAEALGNEAQERANVVTGVVRERVEGGRSPRLDLVRAGSESARIAAAVSALSESRRTAAARLLALLGRDPTTDGRTDGLRPGPLDAETLALLEEESDPGRRPDVLAAEQALRSARAERTAARRRLLPGLSVSLGVSSDDPGLPGTDYQASASLTLPIGVRGAAAVRVADSRVTAVEARLVAARRQAGESLELAIRGVRGSRATLEVLDREAIPAAKEAAALSREAFEAGRGDLLRVLDAERSLLEIRTARLAAWADEKAAEADLLAEAGASEE